MDSKEVVAHEPNTTSLEEIVNNLISELRRGTLVLSVLTQLGTPQYGYSLIQNLSNQGIQIEQNTLYPLLRRLDKMGLLDSEWQVEEARPRRYYKLSELGIKVLKAMRMEWEQMNHSMVKLFQEWDEQ